MVIIKTQFNITIINFRFDGGGEFDNGKFYAFLNENNIKYKVSALNAHSQNNIIKRANRYIGVKTRALLINLILSKYL